MLAKPELRTALRLYEWMTMKALSRLSFSSAAFLVLLGVFATPCASQAPREEKRFALVVANEHYPDIGMLSFSHSDGQIMSAALRALRFDVKQLDEGSITDFRFKLDELKRSVEAAGPSSIVFFYFSGHAAEDGSKNYIILNEKLPSTPKDQSAAAWRKAVLPKIGVPFAEITHGLSALTTRATFVVIDSHLDRDEPSLFETGQLFATQGRPALNAADSNNYSIALSSALLTPGLDAEEIFKGVQVKVAQVTNGRQIPFWKNQIKGVLTLNPSASLVRQDLQDNAWLEDSLWNTVKDSKDSELLQVYLQRFPDGTHTKEVKTQMEEINRLRVIAPARETVKDSARKVRRVALVIGNSTYQNANQLRNPSKDAQAVAEALRGLDFEVVQEERDLGRDAMVRALKSFSETAKGSDWAVVYYAGHGMEVKGTNYLIPVDAKLADEEDAEEEAVPMSRLFDRLKDVSGIKVLILDACRDNPFATRMYRRGISRGGMSRGFREVHAESGTLIAYATNPGDTALDGEGEHSPYVSALLKEIVQRGVDIRIMFSSVYESVEAATNKRQQPWYAAQLPGRPLILRP